MSKTIEEMKSKVWYLAQKYSGTPEEEEKAFQDALRWCNYLEHELGLTVYSPIRETHNQWQYIKKNFKPDKYPHPNYWVERDLVILTAWLKHDSVWICECGAGYSKKQHCNKCNHNMDNAKIRYDSNIGMIFAPTSCSEHFVYFPAPVALGWF